MDTQPPLFYLNDKSKQIISLVNQFNSKFGDNNQLLVAYTFDAGPNAFLFVEDHTLPDLLYVLYRVYFQHGSDGQTIDQTRFIRDYVLVNESRRDQFNDLLLSRVVAAHAAHDDKRKQELDEFCCCFCLAGKRFKKEDADDFNSIKRIIHSKVGGEALVYDSDKFSLLTDLKQKIHP